MFAAYALRRTLHQILVKSNNPQLSYNDLKIENLGADPHLGFHGEWICITAQHLCIPTMCPWTTYSEIDQSIQLIYSDGKIKNSCQIHTISQCAAELGLLMIQQIFLAVSQGGAHLEPPGNGHLFSEFGGPNCTKFGGA